MEQATAEDLREALARHGQEHVLRFWDELDADGRRRLAADVAAVDLDQLDRLVETLVHGEPEPPVDPAALRPPAVERLPGSDPTTVDARTEARAAGEQALRSGEVAVVVVAGGQGTRLGFDAPKGTYPIGPVSGATLFQIHAEKLVALGRRYGRALPLYVMTSPDNHEATAAFLAEHDNFGLERVRLFVQGQMPAVDRESGRLLLGAPDRLALSADGHGGTLRALAAPAPDGGPSCLDEMRERGVRTLFYFQVDNALVRVADADYIGLHRLAGAEVSAKVVEKRDPGEKVGVVVEAGGRPRVVEYSDLPPQLAEQRRPDGGLALWAGSIAVHVFERAFVERLATGGASLPFHRADKAVPHLDDEGRLVEPSGPNAVKFETFIFDTLPLAERALIVETDRTEFEPLKNASGRESPESVRRALSELHAGWLAQAGAHVARDADGSLAFPVEISPLFALGPDDLRARGVDGLVVDGPLYLRP